MKRILTWPTRVQHLKSLAVAIAKIFQGVKILKCHVTPTTLIWGIVRHHKTNTSSSQLYWAFSLELVLLISPVLSPCMRTIKSYMYTIYLRAPRSWPVANRNCRTVRKHRKEKNDNKNRQSSKETAQGNILMTVTKNEECPWVSVF